MCAELEGVIKDYADCMHLIAGDFNFECNSDSVGFNIFNNMATDCGLKCMDNCDDECGYTYCHEVLGHYSWLDHVLLPLLWKKI